MIPGQAEQKAKKASKAKELGEFSDNTGSKQKYLPVRLPFFKSPEDQDEEEKGYQEKASPEKEQSPAKNEEEDEEMKLDPPTLKEEDNFEAPKEFVKHTSNMTKHSS